VSEEFEKDMPAVEKEEEDVEAHWQKPAAAPEAAATEEGPDVEAHNLKPNVKP
jgi:hypothetical protein